MLLVIVLWWVEPVQLAIARSAAAMARLITSWVPA
jgi:hypothetical protein